MGGAGNRPDLNPSQPTAAVMVDKLVQVTALWDGFEPPAFYP
jgi:hypothetical protein